MIRQPDARPGTRDANDARMTTTDKQWTEVRRLADELELKIHLASMDARDRWQMLKPRLTELERKLASTGERVAAVLQDEIGAVAKALHTLRDDLAKRC